MAGQVEEIRIAMFGQSGSGKTTLLASMIGNMGTEAFMMQHGYRFNVHNAADTNASLARFQKMERGEFPMGTADFHAHRFGFQVKGTDEAALNVTIYDYPGGWWQSDASDEQEQQLRQRARASLAHAHVALLFVDGLALKARGDAYVHELLESFNKFLNGFTQHQAALPRSWILAISKADALKEGGELPDARQLWSALHERHGGALAALGGALAAPGDEATQWRVLYLSAVDAADGVVRDAHAMIGADLIVPLALRGVLNSQRAALHQSAPKGFAGFMFGVVPAVTSLASRLPGPLGIPFKLLSALGGLDLLASASTAARDYIDAERIALDERRDKFERLDAMMRVLLLRASSRQLYAESGSPFEAQAVDAASYDIDPRAVLWRTRGAHFDYEFLCKPDLVESFGGWFHVWQQVFGRREPGPAPVYLLGSLNGTPYLASVFRDPVRRDPHGRPIGHFVMWLIFDELEHNPFAQLQVPAAWAQQLVASMSALPEVGGLLEREIPSDGLIELLKDSDAAIDRMAPIQVSGPLTSAEIVPLVELKVLRLPSRADLRAWGAEIEVNRFKADIQEALIEGDTFAMYQHLGLPHGTTIPTPRIRADQASAVFSRAANAASLRRQLKLSFQAGEADHFISARVEGLHSRLAALSQHVKASPRPGFDALLGALRRHKKDIVLANISDPAERRTTLAGWIDEALITDAFLLNLLDALIPPSAPNT